MPLTPAQMEQAYQIYQKHHPRNTTPDLSADKEELISQIYEKHHKKRIGATGTWPISEAEKVAEKDREAKQRGLALIEKEKKQPPIVPELRSLKAEEPISYWTGEGEIKWRHKPVTPEMEAKLAEAKEIRLLRQTADLGDRAEAMIQGVLPVGDKELYEKAFPYSNLGGHFIRLLTSSAITLGAIDPIHNIMMNAKLPYIVAESIPRMTAFAVQRALTYGADQLAENVLKSTTGGPALDFSKIVKEPLKEAGIGSLYGIAHGVTGPELASSLAAGISGGRTLLRKKLQNGEIRKEDLVEALIMAGFTYGLERVGHNQVIQKWHDKETEQFAFDRAYAKYLGRGQSPEDAYFSARIEMNGFTHPHLVERMAKAVHERVIESNIPDKLIPKDVSTQMEIVANVQARLKQNMPAATAISETIGHYLTEIPKGLPFLPEVPEKKLPLLPKFGKQKTVKPVEETKTVTPNLMRYGKQLEAILSREFGYKDEDFKTAKQNKSFSYKKPNSMTKHEAADVINEYEDLIEQSAYMGGEHKKLLKEMDKLRAKFIKAKDQRVFDELIESVIPAELQDSIGSKFYFIDWVRPSWRVFRKDPIVEKHAYLPMSKAYTKTKRFAETAIYEARKKVKELNLTPDERRRVTIKRHIEYFYSIGRDLGKELPVLNDREIEWDSWLTSHFEGLHKFFNVERVIPYNLYIPLINDVEAFEGSILNELYPDYLPKNITAFFEHRRKSQKADKFREDSLDLYEAYVRAGAKKYYMLPAIREARKNVLKNRLVDPTMKSHFQDWGTWMMGYPAMADATFAAMFEKFGLDYEQAYTLSRTLMNLVYMGGIGLRPMAALRNLLQNLNTACELGYTWMSAGLLDLATEGSKRAREAGVLMEYAPEIYTELGRHTEMKKLMHAMMFLFRKADETNRSVAYYSAEKKFDHFFKKYGNTDRFIKESGIRFLHKSKQAEIKALLNDGKTKEAKDAFGKEIAAKTQYLYRKESSPLIQKTLAGKIFFQFKSWPENYLELLGDWTMNKNYQAWARALVTYAMLGFIGNQIGSKWLKKSIPLGTLPVTQWRLERMAIPASLGPLADIMLLFASPMYTGFETQNPEKVAAKFRQRLKRLGNDVLLYIPGGLAMKDLYKVAPFIPMFTKGQQESGNLGVNELSVSDLPSNRMPTQRL